MNRYRWPSTGSRLQPTHRPRQRVERAAHVDGLTATNTRTVGGRLSTRAAPSGPPQRLVLEVVAELHARRTTYRRVEPVLVTGTSSTSCAGAPVLPRGLLGERGARLFRHAPSDRPSIPLRWVHRPSVSPDRAIAAKQARASFSSTTLRNPGIGHLVQPRVGRAPLCVIPVSLMGHLRRPGAKRARGSAGDLRLGSGRLLLADAGSLDRGRQAPVSAASPTGRPRRARSAPSRGLGGSVRTSARRRICGQRSRAGVRRQ
jgi:hypothetical protein